MNLGKNEVCRRFFCAFSILTLFAFFLTGCRDNVVLPDAGQLAAFQNAGPIEPELDLDLLVHSKKSESLYRITFGDMLEIQMPQILQAVSADYEYNSSPMNAAGHFCRVFDNGKITLPIIGEIEAEGKTLSELEKSIIQAYHPKYCKNRPSVVAYVRHYRTSKVSISGAVENPGVYELRSDQLSLVSLIMEAGGITEDGAAVIHVNQNADAADADEAVKPADEEKPAEKQVVKSEPEKKEPEPINFDFDGEISDTSLRFRYRPNPHGKTGTIIASRDDQDIYIKTIDVADPLQRIRFAKDLVLLDKSISPVDALRHISRLAEAIKPGSGYLDAENLDKDLRRELAELIKQKDTSKPRYPDNVGAGALKIAAGDHGLTRELLNVLAADAKIVKDTRGKPERFKEPKEPQPERLQKKENGPLVLPVKGLNIPFADVALKEGASVEVTPLDPEVFTVVGLVGKSGVFPYPPNINYNLMQALAFAGGVDEIANPRYVRVYRRDASGQIVDASFKLTGTSLVGAPNIAIKPGDVVSVEQTPRTKKNLLVAEIFQLRIGASAVMTDVTYRGKDIRSGN